jgi:hypothetical protein
MVPFARVGGGAAVASGAVVKVVLNVDATRGDALLARRGGSLLEDRVPVQAAGTERASVVRSASRSAQVDRPL